MTGTTWSLPSACTPGPLLTAEPGRVTGTSASARTPGLLPPGLSQPPGSGQCRESGCDPAAREPRLLLVLSSEVVTATRAGSTGPRQWGGARGPGGGGSLSPGRGRPRRLGTLPPGTSSCPAPTSAPSQVLVSRVSREGHGLRDFHSHTTAAPPRLRSDCVSPRLPGAAPGFQVRRAGPGVGPCS